VLFRSFLSTIKLNDYNNYYGNVKLLRYSLPNDVLSAIWRLQVIATDNCPATNFYFYLDYSAYPVISPHNSSFPKDFNLGRLSNTYVKRQVSGVSPFNKQDIYLNVSSPNAGFWYSASFVDSNDQMVKPDLLRFNCSFYLTASVSLWKINDTIIVSPNATVSSTPHAFFKIYKYITSSNFDGAVTFEMKFQDSSNTCELTALLRQSAFPDMTMFTKNDDFILCKTSGAFNQTSCELKIDYPLSNAWIYVGISSNCNYTLDVDSTRDCYPSHSSLISQPIGLTTEVAGLTRVGLSQECLKLAPPIETFRFIGPTYFSVKYYFNSNYNRSNSVLIRSDQKPYFIEFLVDLANNGGTLSFSLINNLVIDPNYTAEVIDNASVALNNQSSRVNEFNISGIKIVLKTCLLFNSMSSYKSCPTGYDQSTLSFTNIYTNLRMNIPYPMMGKWYLALWKECFNSSTNEMIACPRGYVPYAVIKMSSDQCANDYCGEYGTCYIINSQLNLVSSCKCSGGYTGYGCTDDSSAVSASFYLSSVLFLTLSNLVFLLPIALAIYRGWYIESLIYFYNMFFSTFYHACDQDFFSFCIFNYDGLQLADFVSSYSSFVITVLSMSAIVRPWKVFSFFVGFLACLSINLYDRFSTIAFIVFLCIAISVTVATWVKVCISKRKLYPTPRTLLIFYLPGFILAVTGLTIYSFLQNKSNYWILHSIWHMCMATSIIFFLPKRESTMPIKMSSNIESLKDVTTTSSLSDSTESQSDSPMQSPINALHTNATEITLLEQ